MSMKNLSLRSKMVLGGTVIVLVPLLIVGTVTFIKSSRDLENISKMQTVQIAKSLSSMIELAIEKEMKFLTSAAKDPLIINAVSRGNYESLRDKLTDLYQKVGTDYEDIAVFDRDGIIRVDAVDKKRVGISVAEREYAKAARRGETGLGPVNTSKATGRPIFGIAAPILSSDGRYLGSVVGVVKAEFLTKYILSLKL